MRAETLWQDRKYEVIKQGVETKKISLRQKQKFQHLVHVIMSDKDNVFIFKFQKKVMGGGTTYTELSKNVYMFEVEALNHEDIILDMRDKIRNELLKVEKKGFMYVQGRNVPFQFSDNFIKEVDGKMEFFVRKVMGQNKQRASIGAMQQEGSNYIWKWVPLNDFDRMAKFGDDEVFDDEVIFKLINTSGEDANDVEEYEDDRSQSILEGYDCYSIYKHQDNSYEWRLCKIIKTEMKPEFKHMAMVQAFADGSNQKQYDITNTAAPATNKAVRDQDKYFYFLEFEHLKEYGEEMWVKRRREDIIFSSRYSRDQPNFEKLCFKFILDSYKN